MTLHFNGAAFLTRKLKPLGSHASEALKCAYQTPTVYGISYCTYNEILVWLWHNIL